MAVRTSLDEALEERRLQLGLRWVDIANTAGITEQTLRVIRRSNGKGVRSLTKRVIEGAVGWRGGSFDRAVSGQAPILESDGAIISRDRVKVPQRAQQIVDDIRRLLDQAELGEETNRAILAILDAKMASAREK